jgi:hypothetical protein
MWIDTSTLVCWTAPTALVNMRRFDALVSSISGLGISAPKYERFLAWAALTPFALALAVWPVIGPSVGALVSGVGFFILAAGLVASARKARTLGRPMPECGCLGGLLSSKVGWTTILLPLALGIAQVSVAASLPLTARATWYVSAEGVVLYAAILVAIDRIGDHRGRRQQWLAVRRLEA